MTACWHCAKIPKAKPIFPCNIGFVKRKRACAKRLLQGFAQKCENDYRIWSAVRQIFYLYFGGQQERCGEMFQFKWMLGKMKGYRAVYAVALCLSVVIQSFFLTGPMIVEQIISIFISSPDALKNIENQRDLLILLCVAMILFVFVRTCLQFLAKTLYEIVSQGVLQKVRNELFERIQNQDMHFFDTHTKGDLVTRLTGDLDMIRHSIAWIIMMVVESCALFLFTVIYFFTLDWLMTLFILALTPILFIVTRMFSKRVGPKYVVLREKLSRLNTKAQENIAANRVVKAFAREEYEKEDFDKYNRDYCEHNQQAAMVWLTFQPYIETLAQALWAVQMLVGGIFVINGRITIAQYTVFSGLLWTIANAMRNIGMLINDLQRFFASISKIIDVYYARPNIENNHNSKERPRLNGDIEFRNVTAKFGDVTVLHDINLHIRHGETVVIMGSTGSGKTTLMNLIARFYDASEGGVYVDGKNVKDYEPDVLRANIGMTTQEVLLFSDTVDGNIAYGKSDLPFEDVKNFAHLASAYFIEKMPEQYDTIIGERGVGLSGGQKQRIALARAMAIRPPILILDDTTSALDMETEAEIQENLNNLDFECTKLIIAQRTSSARYADRIVILEDGRIKECGTHDELMKQRGYYYEIYTLQNGNEEEAV